MKLIDKEKEKKHIVNYLNQFSNNVNFNEMVEYIDNKVTEISGSFFRSEKINFSYFENIAKKREEYLDNKYAELSFIIAYDDILSYLFKIKYSFNSILHHNSSILNGHFNKSSKDFFDNDFLLNFKKKDIQAESKFKGLKIQENLSVESINQKNISLNKDKQKELFFQKIYTHLFEIDIINNTTKLINFFNKFSNDYFYTDLMCSVKNRENLSNYLKSNFILDISLGIINIESKDLELEKKSYSFSELVILNEKIKKRFNESLKKNCNDDDESLIFNIIDDMSFNKKIEDDKKEIEKFINKKNKIKKIGIKIVK